MEVQFSYQWFLQVCKEEGLNPNVIWVEEPIRVAKEYAKSMKKFMDWQKEAPENHREAYENEIKRLDELRITYMFEALEMARLNDNLPVAADKYVRNTLDKFEAEGSSDEYTDAEKRIVDRWNNVGAKSSWEQVNEDYQNRNGGD